MIERARTIAIAAALAVLTACAAPPFQSSWRAPEEKPFAVSGRRIAAWFMSDVEATRRNAEEAMAAEIAARGGRPQEAYALLDAAAGADLARAFERLREAGIEKALVMRPAARDADAYRVYPRFGTRFGGTRGAWGWGWAYDPAWGAIDALVTIETRLYDLSGDRLVWAGASQFRNPVDIPAIARRLAAEAFAAMARDGLID